MKKGKSAGVDNIPTELVQAGGEDVITALTTICNKIWQAGEWPTPWTHSLVITHPKKGKTDTEDDHPILRKELEAAVQSSKKGKSTGVDNIPTELVQAGGQVITALMTICNKIWQTGE